jgi:hypothetical protein
MLMENDGDKMRLSYELNLDEEAISKMAEEEYEDVETPEFEEIGTKNILGYTCKGYRTETEEAVTELWVADEDVFGLDSMFGMKGLGGSGSQPQLNGYPAGSIMEFNTVESASSKKMVWQIVEINEDDSLILVVADYASPESAGADTE